ncbi:dihydroorotase [Rhodoferax sp. 4810]|uniref:Dihydroorotase n=1 Tax=Thiospirillum jenense TaxID=1653858 RepID=A0A839HMR0_9GAMM|nr:dihydroorotase [Thiospirillum jenense]MBB1075123.1 dihydroorotase [Rhodoferax jenense]MBB1126772.1 dihydroorotase [Thiospirillum jenense]
MSSLLILNAQLINEGRSFVADMLIENSRIAAIGADLQSRPADRVIDANGWLLFPGMIDDQVHCREPGLTHKAELFTESRAAAAGGITSFMDMPNTQPPTLDVLTLEHKYARAAQVCCVNYGFYFGASNDNLDAIQRLAIGQACGIKIFMGASTGNLLVDDPLILERIFATAPVLIATHCEDTPTILTNEAAWRARYGDAVPMTAHPEIRSETACWRSSSFAVSLAKRLKTRLHVLHLTTARELTLFIAGNIADKQITAEVCVHHLTFDDRDYATLGTHLKCNPAVKTTADREALRRALTSGQLDVIGTDHAPHTLTEKAQSYFHAPSGLPLVQDALPALFELVHDGYLTPAELVNKTSHAVATCFNLKERGYLREGYYADLTLIHPNAPYTVTNEHVLSKCGWTPFHGRQLRARVMMTIVNGDIVYEHGQINSQVRGQRLQFGPTRQ